MPQQAAIVNAFSVRLRIRGHRATGRPIKLHRVQCVDHQMPGQGSIALAYAEDIERLVAEDFLTDALEKLLDFVRDFAPDLKKEALALYAHHSRVRKNLKQQTGDKQTIGEVHALNAIVEDILAMAERVAAIATEAGAVGASLPQAVHQPAVSEPQVDGAGGVLNRADGGYTLDDYRKMYVAALRRLNPSASENVVVAAKAITKRFSRSDFKLGPLSFELVRGEITGVVGMNASGKTTLLNLVLGRLSPEEGHITYPALGENASWAKIKSQLASVDQLPERWYGSLRHNLNHTAAAFGVLGSKNKDLVDWYVQRYGLHEFADATWDEISGGFKIRFELVRALLSQPRLLVLDEPLAYLDIITQQLFLSDLRSIASSIENPTPIIVTSQHLYEIEAVADRMIILDDGECLFSAPIAHIPEHNEYQCIEATIRASKAEILNALRPIGLVDIEVSVTSYLLFFPKSIDRKVIVAAILEFYGHKLTSFRDISRSTRVLFRNKRDDFEAHVG
jgi:ABC-2 type transport system ATP-binding protein